MVIRLSHAQWAAIRLRISGDLELAMTVNRRASGKSHDYLLPAIGWRRVLDQLTAASYGPYGGKLAGAQSLYRGIAKIAEKVGEIEVHPALFPGRGVVGVRNEIVPAWLPEGVESVGRKRSPYPVPGLIFWIMTPRLTSRKGIDVTYWVASDPHPGDVLQQEAFHLSVCGVAAHQLGG